MGQATEPLFTADDAGRVSAWSEAAELLFGRSADAVLGGRVVEAVRGTDTALCAVPRPDGEGGGWAVYPSDPAEADVEGPLVRALFSVSQLGLLVLDRDLRLIRVSTAARAMHGSAPADLLGRRLEDVYRLESPVEDMAAAHGVLETGEPVFSRLVTVLTVHGLRQYYSVSAFRLCRPGGEVVGLAMTLLDVTRRERDRERAMTVSRVRERVGRSLDLMQTCQDLADALSPGFADLAVVSVTEQLAGGDYPPLQPVDPEKLLLRRAAIRTTGPPDPDEGVSAVETVDRESSFTKALTRTRPLLLRSDRDGLLADDPHRQEALRRAEAHSAIVASLTVRGRVLGLLRVFRCGGSARYTTADLRAVESAVAHAALCLDNARRVAHDRALASTVRQRLLSRVPGAQLGIDTAFVALSPTAHSGAWFDVIPLSGARCGLVVGEVGGTGMASVTAMGHLRTALRVLAGLELQPDELLARLSDTVTQLALERTAASASDGPPLTAACVYALYDPIARTCTVACAGQPAPRLIRPDGRIDRIDAPVGPRLGAPDTEPFAMATAPLDDDCTLILASDDLDPALSTEIISQVLPVYDTAQGLADGIFTRLAAHPVHKGIALLARARPLPARRTSSWALPSEDRAANRARHLTRQWLTEYHHPLDPDDLDSAELLVSELVTNAVRYGTPPVTLRLILDRSLTVEVSDSGATAPSLRHARVTDEGGRGLFIVSCLTEKWGTRQSSAGKTIWAEQHWPTG
ncbi:SpoIIE family protein phosphatase [Streptomyces sp. NBC_00669]|uniref:SpoIIE family protein phosphatase n=1 Tax=Streptomyces sp. NBC_00669 TaxID=2976011 RepID=UPI002E30A7D1|nr:SpoIIE family protein phosphatase [Streptomyces sp. NBC_00669]